jgi:hypothetical protein
MDQREIMRDKFYPVFCEMNLHHKRYAKVWLTFAGSGKAYFNGDLYELNVKLLPRVESNSRELREVIEVLDQKAKQEFKPIILVDIIRADEKKRCKKKDFMIYCDGQ